MSRPRVLIVDDESSVADSLSLAFTSKGWDAVTAASADGAQAELAKTPGFSVLLVDKNLGKVSGLEVIRRLRETDTDIAIVMMTAFSSIDTAQDALNLDVDAYVEKPFPDIFGVIELATTVAARRTARKTRPPVRPGVTPTPRATLRILVVAVGSSSRERLSTVIDKHRGEVIFAGETPELSAGLKADPPDAVVVDGASYGPALLETVERLLTDAPLATYAVVYEPENLGLPALQRLIELGVKGLFDTKTYDRSINELLEKVWVRKSVLDGLGSR